MGTVLKDLCHTLQATTKSDRGSMMTAGVINQEFQSHFWTANHKHRIASENIDGRRKKMVGCDFNCILGICCDMY